MITIQTVVIGSGPGGYTAAFRAADLGQEVILIEKFNSLGGVCLNVGCIPSKALLHTAEIIGEGKHAKDIGVDFGEVKINLDKIRENKDSVVKKLTGGISALAKARKVKVITATAKFKDNKILILDNGEEISFENCIIAAGSSVAKPGIFPWEDPRVMDSTDALELSRDTGKIPKRLLVVGGGIIGLEMATVYSALGSEITIVEGGEQLIGAADKDIVTPLFKKIKKQYANIYLGTKVAKMEAESGGIAVKFEGKTEKTDIFDKVLVAVGRTPNGKLLDCENAGITVDEWGFIPVDKQQKTNVAGIYAIGDIVGQPMLAHKAVHEGKVAAQVIAGQKSFFDAKVIPSVAYTDPEIAWVGKTEKELKAEGAEYEKGVFPWAASGRSLSIGRNEGVSKALFDAKTHRLVGMGICGTNAGELLAEACLGIEMGADMEDIGLTIHAHPTLSETTAFAAEMAEGTITDLLPPKKKG
jgi:dihydrolipoamide dehydrogenase